MTLFFYLFAALALIGGIGVVAYRNPVTSAFSMIVSFLGIAALFILLNAYLVGILQILVYAGAIMVLFLFIIMLLDVKEEQGKTYPVIAITGASVVVIGFLSLVVTALKRSQVGSIGLPRLSDAEGAPTDVQEIGIRLFSEYWFPVQVVGLLLLTATVGVVVLSQKELR